MATKRVIVIPADASKPIHWHETDGSLGPGLHGREVPQ